MRILFNNYLFENPSLIIKCHKLSEVENVFHQMENAIAKGFYLAGFLSYEAGYAFEKILQNPKAYDFPLVYFGAYAKPTSPLLFPSPLCGEGTLHFRLSNSPLHFMERGLRGEDFKRRYLDAVRQIKHYLAAGDTYQVNYTFKHKFNFYGDPFALYQKLKRRQTTPYSAFLKANDFSILSLSPELFFRKQSDRIKVKPMKGTINLGRGKANQLRNDPKSQSENVMIVDLLRNDLGRIAKTGTVKTTKLFEVERYETLYQMTSTIEAKIPKDIDLYNLFRNIFPSGSVTGAPKIRTMQIIHDLEKEERKIYTGSIGFITPQKDMIFNVAIRTILLHPSSFVHRPSCFVGEMGIGSGIVYDSDPEKEFEECLLKAKFLDFHAK